MDSLRVKNKDLYKIEVNDNGEYIEFDLADIGLPVKCYEALEQIEKINLEMIAKRKELQEKTKNETAFFTENKKAIMLLETEMFKKMRDAMDVFLGKGACQKIFGDRNYYEMFDDLINELSKKRKELNGKSHLDMLNLKSNNISKRIMEKYNKNKKYVI